MNRIEHIVEPDRLWLVWQPTGVDLPRRTRRVVAEIRRDPEGGAILHYLRDSDEYRFAQQEGFEGFPGFRVDDAEHDRGVLDTFMRRLPPRKREDFSEYLAMHRLPAPFPGTDMALLAYTGAKLPSDGFEIVPDFSANTPPLEIVIEVAGFRHQRAVALADLNIGDRVFLQPEPDNPQDDQAIAVCHDQGPIGYVGRPHLSAMHRWLHTARIEAEIERINGKPERPLVYLFVRVRPSLAQAA